MKTARRRAGAVEATEPEPTTWSEALERFAAYQRELERSAHTIANYAEDLALFGDWYTNREGGPPVLTTVAGGDLRDFKEFLLDAAEGKLIAVLERDERPSRPSTRRQRKHAHTTVNRKLAALRSFFGWAAEEGWAQPIRFPRSCKLQRPLPKWLSEQEQRKLLRDVERRGNLRDMTMFHLFVRTGARLNELTALERDSFDIGPRKGKVTYLGKGARSERSRSKSRPANWSPSCSTRRRRNTSGPASAAGCRRVPSGASSQATAATSASISRPTSSVTPSAGGWRRSACRSR